MLAELVLKIDDGTKPLDERAGSVMQGVLMHLIDADYAAKLHQTGINPYSQCLLKEECLEWHIRTTTEEAFEKIIEPLNNPDFLEIKIEQKKITLPIKEKSLRSLPKKELLNEFYSEKCDRHLLFAFQTPAAFKSGGHYVILPDMRLIFQSLMNKYNASGEDMQMYDQETCEEIAAQTIVTRYRLRSTSYPLEGLTIPAFRGELGIRIGGSETLARYARLLARFGEFSGVGIKTGMGMGALRLM